MQPSIGDVEGACRKLRRTSRFCPTIAEALEALEAAKQHRHSITRQIIDITTSRDKHVRAVEQEHQRNQEYLEYQRTRSQPSIEFDPAALPL